MKNTTRKLATLLAFVSTILPLSSCDKLSGKEHKHVWSNYIAKQPTCTQNGIMEKLCECGEKVYEDIISAGHNFINGVCSVCGQEGETEDPLKPVPLPTDSDNSAKWSMQDVFDIACQLGVYEYQEDYPLFLDQLSFGNMESFYIDALSLLHLEVSWERKQTLGGGNFEVPLALAIKRVSPSNPKESTLSNIYRLQVLNSELILTYSDGVQLNAGKFLSDNPEDVLIDGFGLNKNDEFIVYYTNDTISFAGKITTDSTAKNQASFVYQQTETGYNIVDVVDNKATTLNIPLTHKGKPIEAIADNAFRNMPNLQKVFIGGNVTALNLDTFKYCPALEYIVIPESVTSIYGFHISSVEIFIEAPSTNFPYLTIWENVYFAGEWTYLNGEPVLNA